jgi:hypothetical protein
MKGGGQDGGAVHQSNIRGHRRGRAAPSTGPKTDQNLRTPAGGAARTPYLTVYPRNCALTEVGEPPEPCPHLDDDPTAAALVSPSPGDTVSAPCRRSRPGPAALDRLRQWWGPVPARPKPVWSTRRVEHGGQRREAAMGKGPPGGCRQAGSIDYRTEPRRSLPPDRPRRA